MKQRDFATASELKRRGSRKKDCYQMMDSLAIGHWLGLEGRSGRVLSVVNLKSYQPETHGGPKLSKYALCPSRNDSRFTKCGAFTKQ